MKPDVLPFSVASGKSGTSATGTSSIEASAPQTQDSFEGKRKRSLPALSIPEGGTSLEELEHSMVELAMTQANGNQSNAAKLLDISRDALRYKLKKFSLVPSDLPLIKE